MQSIKENLRPDQIVFIGVTDVWNPRVEASAEIRDIILEAVEKILYINSAKRMIAASIHLLMICQHKEIQHLQKLKQELTEQSLLKRSFSK